MIIIGLILFLALTVWHLDWAVLLTIAALPAYLIRFSIGGLPMTFLEAMILISFGVWFFSHFLPRAKDLFHRRTERTKYPFAKEIIALLLISLGAAGVAGFSFDALGIWKAYFFEPILLFILVLNLFSEKTGQKKILGALVISSLAISLFAIFQKITGLYINNELWAAAETRRVVSFFGYPNAIGLYLAPLVMIFTGWLFSNFKNGRTEKIGLNILILVTIILAVLSIWFAHCEGALIGLLAGAVIFGLIAGKSWRRLTLAGLVVVILIISFLTPLRQTVISKFTLTDLSGKIRRQQWTETMAMLSGARFITGAGLANYQTVIKPYHQEGIFFNRDNIANFDSVLYGNAELRAKYWQPTEIYLYPHNIFLNFWSELSFLGALLFVWIIIKYLYAALKLEIGYEREGNGERYLALGLLTAMIVISVHGLVDVPYFKNDLAAMFWLMIALIGVYSLNYRQERELKN
jgi:O-antigen ligase